MFGLTPSKYQSGERDGTGGTLVFTADEVIE